MGGRCEPDHGAPTLATGGREFRGGCGGVGCGRACLRWRARARPTVVRVVMKAGFYGVEVGAGGVEVVGAGAEDAERCFHWGRITGSVKLGNKNS